MDIWAGFAIGFLGSFHCVGMCGPIAIALPVFSENKFTILLSRILYNLGRVATYAMFGALFGLFGNRIAMIGFQQNLSIALGVGIILYVATPLKYKNLFANTAIYRRITAAIKSGFAKILSSKSSSSFFLIGILNGFLPCGFVYVALAGALTTDTVLSGAAFMALFGLGTLPIMLGTSMLGKYLNVNIRRKINKLIPVFAVVLAVLFIIRGLGLGIPYLSPKISNFAPQEEVICH